jgi:hypothetical protein
VKGFPEKVLLATAGLENTTLASRAEAGVLQRIEIGTQEIPVVLVATDGSEVSLRAGEYAARQARADDPLRGRGG